MHFTFFVVTTSSYRFLPSLASSSSLQSPLILVSFTFHHSLSVSCYTLLVSHSCIFSHNPLLIIKGKPRFLAIVYKTTRNLILPCLSDFFFSLPSLSYTVCSSITKGLKLLFFKPNALSCLSAFAHTTLFPEHPSNHPRPSGCLIQMMNTYSSFQYSAHVSSSPTITIMIIIQTSLPWMFP